MVQWESEPAAQAAGFVPASDGLGLTHYRSRANRRDHTQLDPERPEGLVYFRNREGQFRLLGAVFTVRAGEPAPTPGGEIFRWHTHDPSCGSFLIEPGQCSGTFRMLHVWTTTAPTVADPWMPHFRDARSG